MLPANLYLLNAVHFLSFDSDLYITTTSNIPFLPIFITVKRIFQASVLYPGPILDVSSVSYLRTLYHCVFKARWHVCNLSVENDVFLKSMLRTQGAIFYYRYWI